MTAMTPWDYFRPLIDYGRKVTWIECRDLEPGEKPQKQRAFDAYNRTMGYHNSPNFKVIATGCSNVCRVVIKSDLEKFDDGTYLLLTP